MSDSYPTDQRNDTVAEDAQAVPTADEASAVTEPQEPQTEPQRSAYDRRNIVQKGTERPDARVRARRPMQGDGRAGGARADQADQRLNVAEDAPTLLLISGSPRKRASSSLVDLIELGAREAGVKTQRFELHDKRISACIGCNACMKTGTCTFAGALSRSGRGFNDDYLELTGLLDRCDGLAVVTPVYFAGPPAQLKALYDRFQPYWVRKYVLGQPFPKRRRAQLFVIGSGGDPHGFEPLVTISRSCLQIAGFEMEKVNNFIGYLSPKDAPKEPSARERESMSMRDLSLLRRRIEEQEDLCNRGLAAGRAFGRLLLQDKALKGEDAALAVSAVLGEPGDPDASEDKPAVKTSASDDLAKVAERAAELAAEAEAAEAAAAAEAEAEPEAEPVAEVDGADEAATEEEPDAAEPAAEGEPEAEPAADDDAGDGDSADDASDAAGA